MSDQRGTVHAAARVRTPPALGQPVLSGGRPWISRRCDGSTRRVAMQLERQPLSSPSPTSFASVHMFRAAMPRVLNIARLRLREKCDRPST